MTGEVGNLEKAGGHVKEVAICFPLDKYLIILQVLVSQLLCDEGLCVHFEGELFT